MARNTWKGGLSGYQGFFLALTLVVMVVIATLSKDLVTAILLISLIANFLIISSQLTLLADRHTRNSGSGGDEDDRDLAASAVSPPGLLLVSGLSERMAPPSALLDSLTGAPGPSAPGPLLASLAEGRGAAPQAAGAAYPGAIDFGGEGPTASDQALAVGHADWGEEGLARRPEGNPHPWGRVSTPQAAPPCVDDDAVAVLDGDELMAYHGRARNDPERVWAGARRRKGLVARYVQEELDEKENSVWWGAHET